MMNLIFLVSAAFNICCGLYLIRESNRLRKANNVLAGVVKMIKTQPVFAEPFEALREATTAIWAMAQDGWLFFGPEGMSDAQKLVCDFTAKYPQPSEPSELPEHPNAES